MLKTHKYRSLSLLLTLGVVVGQLFPVLADDELPTVETTPETEEFDSPENLGTDDDNGFGDDFGDENPGNDDNGSGTATTEQPVETPPASDSTPPAPDSTPELPAASNPGATNPTEPVEPIPAPGPQEVNLTGNAEEEKIKVEGSTASDILPEGTFVQVGLLEEDQKTAILQGLKDSKYSIDGILPIDISFLVNGVDSENNPVIQSITPKEPVDLKLSINKDLIQSDKDINWKSVELVKVTQNGEGKYQKETLIKNNDLELVDPPITAEPVDVDQNPEPTEDTASGTVQESAPAQTTESGSVSEPTELSASNKVFTETTTPETTAFDLVEDTEEKKAGDINAGKSSSETSKAYQGIITLDGSTQIALTWKNKRSSILDEFKDSIGNTIGSLTEGIKDIFDKLENADLDFSFMNSSSNKNEQDNKGSDDNDSFATPDLEIDKAETKKPDSATSKPSTQDTDGDPAKESEKVSFEDSIEGITVKATATKDALPEDAKMRVSMITDEQSAAYTDAIDALDSSNAKYDGVQVIDISFWQGEKEIEPENGAVDIQMNFTKDLIDENVEDGSIEIHHIDESGQEKVAEKVATEPANITEKTESEEYEAGFSVPSFSSFAITWQSNNKTVNIKVTLVDEDGNQIDSVKTDKIELTDENLTMPLANYGNSYAPSSYSYQKAQYKEKNSSLRIVDTLVFEKNDEYGIQYVILKNENQLIKRSQVQNAVNINLEFVYKKSSQYDWKVIFNANGGDENPPDEITGVYGSSITLPDYSGKKDGYTFEGWSTVDNTESPTPTLMLKVGDYYTPSAEQTPLYAVWNSTSESDYRNAEFFFRKDGNIPQEPAGYDGSPYTPAGTATSAVTKTRWIVDVKVESLNIPEIQMIGNKESGYYYVAVNDVSRALKNFPTVDEIKAAYKNTDMGKNGSTFNPEKHIVYWYVQKWQVNGAVYSWHVDGVILNVDLLRVAYDRNCSDTSVQVPIGYSDVKGTQIAVGATRSQNQEGNSEYSYFEMKRDGYNFKGWALVPNPGVEDKIYNTMDPFILNQNTTFYAQWEQNVSSVTIIKSVTGNAADLSKSFGFTVQIKDSTGKVYEKANSDKGVTFVNGKYNFSLSNGQFISFAVPEGGSCTVEEVDPGSYTVTSQVNRKNEIEDKVRTVEEINKPTEVLYQNNLNATVPSGLGDGNHHAFTLMIGAGLAVMLGLLATKAYRRMNGI